MGDTVVLVYIEVGRDAEMVCSVRSVPLKRDTCVPMVNNQYTMLAKYGDLYVEIQMQIWMMARERSLVERDLEVALGPYLAIIASE